MEHIHIHEVSLLGKTNDNNHFALLFPFTLRGVTSHWFFGLPKASVKTWEDLKDKFIVQYMSGRQFLKSVTPWTTSDKRATRVWETSTCASTKELTCVDQVITGGESIRAFVKALGPRGSALYGNLCIIPINTIEGMTTIVKSHIVLEIAKEVRKALRNPRRRSTWEKGGVADAKE